MRVGQRLPPPPLLSKRQPATPPAVAHDVSSADFILQKNITLHAII
jgi:hypothetical protein